MEFEREGLIARSLHDASRDKREQTERWVCSRDHCSACETAFDTSWRICPNPDCWVLNP